MTTVLISGAGIAGPVLAYWLRSCPARGRRSASCPDPERIHIGG
jgi:hypothetical protein